MTEEPDQVRPCFEAASASFVRVVTAIDADAWGRAAALGEWTVRDLVGHASRALSTVESYLNAPTDPAARTLDGPVDYYLALAATGLDHQAVAQRGRQAGVALGGDPAGAVRSLADRVTSLVGASADDAPVATPLATMALSAYLPTRTFELAVHSLDLTEATGMAIPDELAGPVAASVALAATVAGTTSSAADVLLALTGRRPLPEGFSVV